jgi:uncharacterized protein
LSILREAARLLGALLIVGIIAVALMTLVALRDPVVRRADVAMPDWPQGARPIRVVLLADIHMGPPDMPPHRLARIVGQVNALHPDLVLIAGDFISDKHWRRLGNVAEALAPLARLDSPLGTYAVLGNHDHWRGLPEVMPALREARVKVLVNQAAEVGPLSVGGVDDAFTGHDNVRMTVDAMRPLKGARVMLTHSPDVGPSVPNNVSLILAGHTHCGQIRLPLIGALEYQSKYGARFGCGLARDGVKRVITSAGIGTSMVPLRLGAVPDMWLITLGPQR